MARIVLTCWGSHGDIDPFLGLGLGLIGEAIASRSPRSSTTGPWLNRQGSRSADQACYRSARHTSHRAHHASLTRQRVPADRNPVSGYRGDVRGHQRGGRGADLLIGHPITFATPIVAEHRRLPWASAVLAPTSMFSSYDMPAIPPAPWLKSLERLGHWPGALVMRIVRRATADVA